MLGQYCARNNIFYYDATAWKLFVFGIFLVRIFPHSEWKQTRKTSNTDILHAVSTTTDLKISGGGDFTTIILEKALAYSTQAIEKWRKHEKTIIFRCWNYSVARISLQTAIAGKKHIQSFLTLQLHTRT